MPIFTIDWKVTRDLHAIDTVNGNQVSGILFTFGHIQKKLPN